MKKIMRVPDREDLCLDPALGGQLWQLGIPDCPAGLRERLETHLKYCASCRLQFAIEQRVEAGLRAGDLTLRPAAPAWSRLTPWAVGGGAAALAAGLALMLLLPPQALHDAMALRGDDAPAIQRPVADEVVLGGRPTLRWTPLAGATRYDVRVMAVDGGHVWTASVDDAQVTVPEGEDLPLDARFRVRIEPIPPHLAPREGLRTSFRTGNTGAWLRHRASHGSSGGRWLGGVGLAGILAGLAGLFARRLVR